MGLDFFVRLARKIGNANFKCALTNFEQQLALKMRAHCRIPIVLLNCAIRDMMRSMRRLKRTFSFC